HTRCYRDWSSDVCSSDLRRILAIFDANAPETTKFHRPGGFEKAQPRPSQVKIRQARLEWRKSWLGRQFEGFHSPESVQHPDFYRYQEFYPRRNGSPRNCCSRAGDERNAIPVSV